MNYVVEKNITIETSIDTFTDVNCISQKHISELGITYHSESNSIVTPDTSYLTLGKVNLHIGFEDGKKHKSIPVEFIVLGPEWPGPDLILGGPQFQENGATSSASLKPMNSMLFNIAYVEQHFQKQNNIKLIKQCIEQHGSTKICVLIV